MRKLLAGFTLIEIVITVAIVALLASVAVPLVELSVQRSKEQELRIALRQIREALDGYKQAGEEGRIAKSPIDSGYPKTLQLLVEGVPDIKSPSATKIYFLRRIPRDPFQSAQLTPEQSWGKRSYTSPPDYPQEGDDIFDVYSTTQGKAMNGIPYSQW